MIIMVLKTKIQTKFQNLKIHYESSNQIKFNIPQFKFTIYNQSSSKHMTNQSQTYNQSNSKPSKSFTNNSINF